MQESSILPITDTTVEHETVIEMNQVISIRGPDIYQPKILHKNKSIYIALALLK
ncbi:14975_t:CDS:1, partial [Dentiscutata erythropus]